MLRLSPLLLKLRPRDLSYTAPPLARRTGDFKCRVCDNKWHSRHVWVTKLTHQCYQGENCQKCGANTRPFYVGYLEKDDFFDPHKTPHVAGFGKSTSRKQSKSRHFKLQNQKVNRRYQPS
jgi:zygote arrest protein 1